ncbi:BON domain-containing protein [Pseudodesulfovibrio cashew]|uniref:BON domain-containing protein n=1 Tax=Pseudodesulfovibrio cashew TaxID=2678688 RepID=A0A6I6JA75_9BACT|nr:BON domain-containing protein [Pseudodesulfovibrio cashew]QGY38961.1 BON domain-containing protein [Pseudodesulfovibrio cashew]
MKRHLTILMLLLALVGLQALSGCAVYDVAVEERNAGDWANDKQISFLIEKQFLEDDAIKYLDFDAYSYYGHVYLVGEYENRGQVERAVAIAKATEGVRQVTTYFLPKREEDLCGTTDNLEISATIRQKLITDKTIWSTNIDIEMIQCNVVLLGVVGDKTQKAKAEAYARETPGVRNVKSYLTVN